MANMRDSYTLDSKADTSGIQGATNAIKRHASAVTSLGQRAANIRGKISSARAALSSLAKTPVGARMVGAGRALSNMAGGLKKMRPAAAGAVRGMAGLTRGIGVLLTSGIFVLVGLLTRLPALFGSMREAVESTSDSIGGGGGINEGLEGTSSAAENAGSSLGKAAKAAEETAERIKGVFGAFGQVGAGFVQRQGRIYDSTKSAADSAVDAADAAIDAMSDAEAATGGAIKSTSRFGSALDRISTAWGKAKDKILSALAEALTPALEKLADLMESPAFQKFVDLLAEELAEAVEKVAGWFIDEGIPAFEDWMEQVNEAGGLFAWLAKVFEEQKEKMKRIIYMLAVIIRGRLTIIRMDWKRAWENMKAAAQAIWDKIKEGARTLVNWVSEKISGLKEALEAPFVGLPDFVSGIFSSIVKKVVDGVNYIISVINSLISAYNSVARKLGVPTIGSMKSIKIPEMARGGIVTSPTLALLGERGPEAVVPLGRRGLAGAGGINITVHNTIQGPFGPGYTPRQVGDELAESLNRRLIREAQKRGLTL